MAVGTNTLKCSKAGCEQPRRGGDANYCGDHIIADDPQVAVTWLIEKLADLTNRVTTLEAERKPKGRKAVN